MRRAKIFVNSTLAGLLTESEGKYVVEYMDSYQGPPISLPMPITRKRYEFLNFPSFFEGLLPEGPQLEALLRNSKIARNDYFSQLLLVGGDLVGSVTVLEES